MSLPTTTFDPNRNDLAPYGFSCARWTPSVMRRPDRHNEIELNFLTEGWVTYLFGGKIVRIEPQRLSVFWAAVPHQIIDHGGQLDYYVVTIPLGWFLQLRLPEAFVFALMHGQVLASPTSDLGHLELSHLQDWENDYRSKETADRTPTLLEIEATIRRLSVRCSELRVLERSTQRRHDLIHAGILAKAERMAHLVANGYAEPIDTTEFAREIGMKPKAALRLFHMVFGTSLATFVTEYRIAQAQRLLVTTQMRVVDISESAGFGSLSRFNRAFQQVCGCSPREYRKRHSLISPTSARA